MKKKAGRKASMKWIAGRNKVGNDTLKCSRCGRFWGGDDIDAAKQEDTKEVVGRCPKPCEGKVVVA